MSDTAWLVVLLVANLLIYILSMLEGKLEGRFHITLTLLSMICLGLFAGECLTKWGWLE